MCTICLGKFTRYTQDMNRRQFLAASASGVALAPAQSQTSGSGGFSSLFDGKTVDGWTVREGPESAFYVEDGSIVVHESGGFPAWLRSDKQYENFDFHCDFFIKGWMDSGIYIHAPEHGRSTWCGMKI